MVRLYRFGLGNEIQLSSLSLAHNHHGCFRLVGVCHCRHQNGSTLGRSYRNRFISLLFELAFQLANDFYRSALPLSPLDFKRARIEKRRIYRFNKASHLSLRLGCAQLGLEKVGCSQLVERCFTGYRSCFGGILSQQRARRLVIERTFAFSFKIASIM